MLSSNEVLLRLLLVSHACILAQQTVLFSKYDDLVSKKIMKLFCFHAFSHRVHFEKRKTHSASFSFTFTLLFSPIEQDDPLQITSEEPGLY